MNIGIDIHGVIDKYPGTFANLSFTWAGLGHDICIITGQEKEGVISKLKDFDITYHEIYSIIDYHKDKGSKMWNDDVRGKGWWIDEQKWIKTKGIIAKEIGLKIHFDDQIEYAPYFPEDCTFIWVRNDFGFFLQI